MIDVKKTTISIPTDTLVKIKELAVRKGTTQNKIINEFINNGLKDIGKGQKNKFIKDRLPKPKNVTKKYDSLKDMAGICEIENPENTDINDIIDNALYKMDLYK
jgi:hypothetical protein